MSDIESTHRYLKEQFQALDYYGDNLDALWDVLTELGETTDVHISHWEEALTSLGEYGKRIGWILEEAVEENEYLRVWIT